MKAHLKQLLLISLFSLVVSYIAFGLWAVWYFEAPPIMVLLWLPFVILAYLTL